MVSTFQWNLCGIAWFQHLGGCQSMGFNGGSTVARLSSVIYYVITPIKALCTCKYHITFFSLLTPGCINNQLLRKWWAYHSWAGSCLPLPYPRNWRLLLLLLCSLGDLRRFHGLVQRLTRWLLAKGQWDALRLFHSTTDIVLQASRHKC